MEKTLEQQISEAQTAFLNAEQKKIERIERIFQKLAAFMIPLLTFVSLLLYAILLELVTLPTINDQAFPLPPTLKTSVYEDLGYLALLAALYILVSVTSVMKIDVHGPLFLLPVWYIVGCLALLGIVWLAFLPTGFQLYVHGMLFFSVCCLTGLQARASMHLKKLLKIEQEVKQQAEKAKTEGKSAPQVCSLCEKDSQYDVCLDCEKLYGKERQRVRAQILRAKEAGVPATLTLAQWLKTLNAFHWKCAYCLGPFECLDHYIPVVAGGGTVEDNCFPACITCNSKKSGTHPEQASRSKNAPPMTRHPIHSSERVRLRTSGKPAKPGQIGKKEL